MSALSTEAGAVANVQFLAGRGRQLATLSGTNAAIGLNPLQPFLSKANTSDALHADELPLD
jgi:hypothetical protein